MVVNCTQRAEGILGDCVLSTDANVLKKERATSRVALKRTETGKWIIQKVVPPLNF